MHENYWRFLLEATQIDPLPLGQITVFGGMARPFAKSAAAGTQMSAQVGSPERPTRP
jgi:hypothetical protein